MLLKFRRQPLVRSPWGPQLQRSAGVLVQLGAQGKGGALCFGLEKPSLFILVRYLLLVIKLNSQMAAHGSLIRYALTFSPVHITVTDSVAIQQNYCN